MISKEILDWVLENGITGALILVFVGTCRVLYGWAMRAEPVTAVRAILNYRANQLDRMLDRPELSALTCKRIRLEQRQRAHIFLSGLREPRLADTAVTFTTLYRLRGRYLTPWRGWLRESEGQIIFSEAAWKRAWRFYCYVSLPGSTLALLFLTWLFASDFGIRTVGPFLLINALIWWLPWVTLTAIPFPTMTRIMVTRVNGYNARISDKQRAAD